MFGMHPEDGSRIGGTQAAAGVVDSLANAARFALADRVLAVRVWPRGEWEALPAESRPDSAAPTPDGRHWVALDLVARQR